MVRANPIIDLLVYRNAKQLLLTFLVFPISHHSGNAKPKHFFEPFTIFSHIAFEIIKNRFLYQIIVIYVRRSKFALLVRLHILYPYFVLQNNSEWLLRVFSGDISVDSACQLKSSLVV